ncbi:MAG: guanylate kinase [Planctomycetes bacterium]|nr:guanylate kinase [Planctomycetota bacterium]
MNSPEASSTGRPSANLLVVLSGPAGVGKTSVRDLLLQDSRFVFSVSATTRPPRPAEREGVDYHFLSESDFESRVRRGEFLEHAVVHGNRYGTLKQEVMEALERGGVPLLDVDVQGAASIRSLGWPAIYVFIRPPCFEELERRIKGRKTEDPSSTARRLARAREELDLASTYDFVSTNDDLERCTNEIRRYLESRLRPT